MPWGAILQPHQDPQSTDPTHFNAPHLSCSRSHNFISTAHHYNRAFTNTLSPSPGKAPTLALVPAWPGSPQGHTVGLTVHGTAPASRGAQQAPWPDSGHSPRRPALPLASQALRPPTHPRLLRSFLITELPEAPLRPSHRSLVRHFRTVPAPSRAEPLPRSGPRGTHGSKQFPFPISCPSTESTTRSHI